SAVSTPRGREISSDTRKPVAYRVSSSAYSLSARRRAAPSGARSPACAAVSSNVSTSAKERILGSGRGRRGLSIAEQGSSLRKPSASRKRKNWRMAESFRAREVGARPLRARPAKKPRRFSGVAVFAVLPLAVRKARNSERSRVYASRVWAAAPRSAVSMSRKSASSVGHLPRDDVLARLKTLRLRKRTPRLYCVRLGAPAGAAPGVVLPASALGEGVDAV